MRAFKAIVISAFPACGKSVYFKEWSQYSKENHWKGGTMHGSDELCGDKILDSDSSDFSWVKDKDGNNTTERNPDFPKNYIQHIKDHLYTEDIIFVSSHDVVRKALEENNIDYFLVYPDRSLETAWVRRMEDRGNNEKFISFITTNWDKFIDDIEAETFPTKIKLEGTYSYIDNTFINDIREMENVNSHFNINEVNRFIRKPQVIGAIQFNGNNIEAIKDFSGRNAVFDLSIGVRSIGSRGKGRRIIIEDDIFPSYVHINDFVTLNDDNKINILTSEKFFELYETVGNTSVDVEC